jgi:hypothetical protein
VSFSRITHTLGPALQAQGVQGALYHLELADFFRPVAQLAAIYVMTVNRSAGATACTRRDICVRVSVVIEGGTTSRSTFWP